jgi:ABC-2 type transport system ATP-binding protein
MSDNLLEIKSVVKTYQQYTAVNEVSFNVPRGSIFGLLGPNGAGKTSLIRMITTITRPDAGQILFDGQPLNEQHPEQIGYMPEERGLYKKMKVGEQLMYLAQLKGLGAKEAQKALDEWLQKFEITDWWNKKVEELSKGMQQKIQFIATVIHRPKLLILDEPFSGLDPVNTNIIKDEIDQLHREGTTILFSTHRMEQVEEICQNIVLINKGQNILQGSVAEVQQRFKENRFRVAYSGTLPETLGDDLEVVSRSDKDIVIHAPEGQNSNTLLRRLLDHQVHITAFHEVLPSLNEIFIKQVGGKSHE